MVISREDLFEMKRLNDLVFLHIGDKSAIKLETNCLRSRIKTAKKHRDIQTVSKIFP